MPHSAKTNLQKFSLQRFLKLDLSISILVKTEVAKTEEVKAAIVETENLKSELTCCDIKFKKPYFLERHISAVHRKEKPFVC